MSSREVEIDAVMQARRGGGDDRDTGDRICDGGAGEDICGLGWAFGQCFVGAEARDGDDVGEATKMCAGLGMGS
ncbi:hypothetical protein M0R45_026459 [Rubus argutus]|uniref:Uncharacterized protein n=1 Tax=Rubus argutus TaxID=59490 RepID=A0AAW1X140_RUBAR